MVMWLARRNIDGDFGMGRRPKDPISQFKTATTPEDAT
jgi:hypothetical protein